MKSLEVKWLVEYIRRSAELAALLEVSGWPKPGNVHRTRDHGDSRFEHFLAGSIALGNSIEAAVFKGIMVAKGRLSPSEVNVGKLIKMAVKDVMSSHKGGNTHLGICLLFIPTSIAAAKTHVEEGCFQLTSFKENFGVIMRSTTPIDAAKVYEAIVMASSPHEMGKVADGSTPDLYDRDAKKKILDGGITLYDVMAESSSYDGVARELVTELEISSNIGFKEMMETFKRTGDINIAVVHTFLKILSIFPDTFIARKIGLKYESNIKRAVEIGVKKTIWISKEAERILNIGGLTTKEGRSALWELDEKLQSLGKDYSPGTTADLTASSIMIALLSGLKF